MVRGVYHCRRIKPKELNLMCRVAGRGIVTLVIGSASRMVAVILGMWPSILTFKERVLVSIAWLPKATVQAAIGGLALQSAMASGDPEEIRWGQEVRICFSSKLLLKINVVLLRFW